MDDGETAPPAPRSLSRADLLSEQIVAALAATKKFDILADTRAYLTPTYRAVLDLLERGERHASEPAIDEALNLVMLRSEEVPEAEFASLRNHLFLEHIKKERIRLIALVHEAEARGDHGAVDAALASLKDLPTV